ncbi:P-loop containing nucleoside triphosphate hydrolase protein [Mycena leptocephala]|nr:P-loop containing nucleoside triphosphate hydrolase protein [Mycena leptocephala]
MSSRKLTIALLGACSAGLSSSYHELPRFLFTSGKSSLIRRYCEGKFDDSYFPTIDCCHLGKVTVNDIPYELRILDTSGQDESLILKERYIYGTHVYAYSIASRRCFDLIRILYDEIFGLYGIPIPCVIVGCKSDLEQQ